MNVEYIAFKYELPLYIQWTCAADSLNLYEIPIILYVYMIQ